MKATIDQDGCIACALCEELCPEVFAMTDDGPATVICDTIAAENEDAAKEAAEACPTEVINLT